MADRCPNCDQPVLATDITCWHCGYQLPKRTNARPAAAPVSVSPSGQLGTPGEVTAKPTEYDWRALAIYGLLTVAIVVGLGLVMRSLNRQPILVRSAGIDLNGEWVIVTDSVAMSLVVASKSAPFHFEGQPASKFQRATSAPVES